MTKYLKIIIPLILVVAALFYFIGQCNGKRKAALNQPDTLKSYISKVEEKNTILLTENTKLKELWRKDSLKMIEIEKERNNIQIVYIKSADSSRHLPLNKAVKFMAENLHDNTGISVIVKGKDTSVCIQPKDVYTVNNEFLSAEYLAWDDSLLRNDIIVANSRDSACSAMISNYDQILKGKDNINAALITGNKNLTTQVAAITKQYKRQRFWKYVCKGGFIAALIFAAVK